MPGELYGATVLRVANINGVPVHRLLGIGAGAFRDVAKVRDHGEAVDRFAILFDADASLSRRLRREGTLLGYYLGDRLAGEHSVRLCVRSALRRGASLRFCPDCALEDRDRCGTPTWRVGHQLPLTETCLRHRCTLIDVCMPNEMELPNPASMSPSSTAQVQMGDLALHLSTIENAVWQSRMTTGAYANLVSQLRGRLIAEGVKAAAALIDSTFTGSHVNPLLSFLCGAERLERSCDNWHVDPPGDADPTVTTLIYAALEQKLRSATLAIC